MSYDPAHWSLEGGSLLTGENEVIVLTPTQTREDGKLQTSLDDKFDNCEETELRLGFPIMIFESVHFKMVPPILSQVLLIPTEELSTE